MLVSGATTRYSAHMAVHSNAQPEGQSLNERLRENIRLLKAFRQISDAVIAERAGYTSRQQVADRIGGRTGFSADDIDSIAQALLIDRDALLKPAAEMMVLVTTTPEPTPPAPTKRAARRKAAPRKAASKS